jgi:hypothetical protein
LACVLLYVGYMCVLLCGEMSLSHGICVMSDFDVFQLRYIGLKCSRVFCSCEIIELLSVVFYLVKSCA